MKRPVMIASIVGVLFVLMAGATAYFFMSEVLPDFNDTSALTHQDTQDNARVVADQGDTTVVRGGEEMPVDGEMNIQEGDEVKVAEEGYATLYWVDGSLSRISGPATLQVTAMHFDDNNNLEAKIDIQAGDVWTKVMNMLTEESTVEITAQNTVAGIRGTSIRHQVSGTGAVITPYDHGVVLQTKDEEYTLAEGETIISPSDGSVQKEDTQLDEDYRKLQEGKDKTYLGKLAEERIKNLQEHKPDVADVDMLKSIDSFVKTGSFPQKDQEKTRKIALNYIASQVATSMDNADIAAIEKYTTLYGAVLTEWIAQAPESQYKEILTLMDTHTRSLLVEDTNLDLLPFRSAVVRAKLTMAEKSHKEEVVRRIVSKELFFAHDLQKQGDTAAMDQVMKDLRQLSPEVKQYFEGQDSKEGVFIKQYLDKIQSGAPALEGETTDIRQTLFPVDPMITAKSLIMQRDKEGFLQMYAQLDAKQREVIMATYPIVKTWLGGDDNDNQNTNADTNDNSNTGILERNANTNSNFNANTNAKSNVNSNVAIKSNANVNAVVKTNVNSNATTTQTNTNVASSTNTNTAVNTTNANTNTAIIDPAPSRTLVPLDTSTSRSAFTTIK